MVRPLTLTRKEAPARRIAPGFAILLGVLLGVLIAVVVKVLLASAVGGHIYE